MADMLLFPDAEAAAAHAIRDEGIAGLNGVYSSLPNAPDWPVAVVERVPSIPVERRSFDRAAIQVSVWATSKSDAQDIAQEARIAIHRLEGVTLTLEDGAPVDCEVSAVRDDLGLQWLPDPVSKKDRYIFQVSLYVRGLRPVQS